MNAQTPTITKIADNGFNKFFNLTCLSTDAFWFNKSVFDLLYCKINM